MAFNPNPLAIESGDTEAANEAILTSIKLGVPITMKEINRERVNKKLTGPQRRARSIRRTLRAPLAESEARNQFQKNS